MKIALLTGRSSWSSIRLPQRQADFLAAVAPRHASIIQTGWPYTGLPDVPYVEPSLLAASARNAALVLRVVTGLQAVHIPPVDVVITGSCGLELVNAAPKVPGRIIALGPTCLRPLMLPNVTTIRGRRDLWSRLFFRQSVDIECDCGHLDYYDNEEVRRIVKGLLERHAD